MSQSTDREHPKGNERLRVLVVDDEPTLRLSFAYALSNPEILVETASNGRHALDRIAQVDFDIMILDLRMPEMDGLGVIDSLRAQNNLIPIVLCSAILNSSATLHAIRKGVMDFLIKPVRPSDLREVIQAIIHPNKEPLSQALLAARQLRIDEALRILEAEPQKDRRMVSWNLIFKTLLDDEAEQESTRHQRQLADCLPFLAFNSSPTV